jgi:hypothetical protein
MAESIGNILNKLAAKAGVKLNPELLTLPTPVPDEIASAFEAYITQDLMTKDVAKKHPEIAAHYNATIFNGLDAKIKSMATEYELDASEQAEIDAEKNSYEKYKLLTTKLTSKLKAERDAASGSDKKALAEDIKRLNGELAAYKESSQKEILAARQQAEQDVLNYALDATLGSKNYANKDIPSEVNVLTAKNLLQSELDKIGAKVVRKDGKLTLVSAATPDVEYIDTKTNKIVQFNDLTDKLLADNKLLQVSGSSATVQNTNQNQNYNTNNNGKVNNSKVTDAITRQLEELGVTS